MSARDDYPVDSAGEQHETMCDEIDRLRDALNALNPFRHDHNPLNEDFHGGMCPACDWWADLAIVVALDARDDEDDAEALAWWRSQQ